MNRILFGFCIIGGSVNHWAIASAPRTIVHGLIAVKDKGKREQQHAVRFLIDTGATESCISEAFVSGIGAPVRSKMETLSMANGSLAHSKGTVVLPINMQDYWSEAVFKVFPMNSNFDVILGRDWCNHVSCDILYSSGLMRFQSPTTGKFHEIVLQPVSHGIVCPVISSVDLDKHIETGDTVYTCHVTAQTTELNTSDSDKVQVILEQYRDVFPDALPAELPPERSVYHTIPLKDSNAVPPARKTYRLSQPELEECKQQVTALLAKGHIRPSCSPYGSPVLFVKKATGGLRMCIDFRGLNEQTIKNRYPLPRIDELFDKLQGATVFSGIDLQSAYNQVRLKPEDVPKTAFTTPFGLFEFKVLCFGLTNAPGTFQNIMNDVLKDVIGKFVLVYLDDIVIYSHSEEEHMLHLKIVLELLRAHKLYAKLSKCKFVQSELKFLGHIISAKGIQVDPAKVSIVKDWPVPKSKHDMQKFLGLANYFRKFIMGYAQLVAPMQQLTKKDKDYAWTEECNAAFTGVKNALCAAPVLALPDLQRPFEVVCDASGVGLGAVLIQDGRPISFWAKRLSEAEQNYAVGEQEMLAVVHALELWHCYLDGPDFTVVTDHSPNVFFANKKLLNPRQKRWNERIQPYKFEWEYRPGRTNVADPLSRHPSFFAESSTVAAALRSSAAASFPAMSSILASSLASITARISAVSMAAPANTNAEAENEAAQQQDQDMLSQIVQGYDTDPWFQQEHHVAGLELYNGLFYKGDALVIPDNAELKNFILRELHDSNYCGHVGYHRTQHNVQRRYWWPGMAAEIREYVQGCQVCQRDKASNQKPAGLLQPIEVPYNGWDHATMDRITQLPKTKRGHTAILVVVDKLTKMTRFAPVKNESTAADIAQAFVEHVWNSHGMPLQITTDRGTEFTNAFSKSLCDIIGTKHTKSTSYHPQTDGQTERMNRVLEDMLRHYITPKMDNWDDMLPVLEFAINNSYQDSIKDTPFYANYGKHPRLPDDIKREGKPSRNPQAYDFIDNIEKTITKAKACLKDAQHRQKQHYDARHRDLQFKVGDKVWLSSKNIPIVTIGTRKLYPLWLGPFPVTKKVGAVAYQLEIPPHYRLHNTFHVGLLKPAYDNHAGTPPPAPVLVEGEDEFEIDTILQHRPITKSRGDKNISYRVKWLGYGPEYNSWEPERNIKQHAPETLQEYWDEVAVQAAPKHVTGSGTGLAPSDQRSQRVTRSRSRNSRVRLVRPIGRVNCARQLARASKGISQVSSRID